MQQQQRDEGVARPPPPPTRRDMEPYHDIVNSVFEHNVDEMERILRTAAQVGPLLSQLIIMRPSEEAALRVLPVRWSFCPVRAPNSRTKSRRKSKIGVNVPQGTCHNCADFHF